MVQFFYSSELLEDINLDSFLKEDQATLAKKGKGVCVTGCQRAPGLPPV